jgi:hypothetical protein
LDVGLILKLGVAGSVVAVAVGVHDEQGDGGAVIAFEPFGDDVLDDFAGSGLTGAGVLEEGAVAAKDEIEKRLLIVGAPGLAEDVEVLIVFVDLPVRDLDAAGSAGDPGFGENAWLDGSAIGLGDLCGGDGARDKDSENDFHINAVLGLGNCERGRRH